MKSRSYYAKHNMMTGFLNKSIVLILAFITRTVVIHELGAEYLGIGSLITSILQVLNMAELGFSSAIVFSLYKPIAENDTELICSLLLYYRRIYRSIGVIILICGGICTPFLPYMIKGDCPPDINIYALYWIFLVNASISYLFYAYKNVIFSASQRQDILNNTNTVIGIIKSVIQIIILVKTGSYYVYVVVNLIFTIVENITIAVLTKKYHPDYLCYGILSEEKKRDITKRVKGLAIGQLCKISRNSFDSIVISFFCGLVEVAVYSNYYYIFNAILGVTSIFIQSINAGVGNSLSTETTTKNYSDFLKFYMGFSLIGSACTVCLYNMYQPFMRLWVGKSLVASDTTMHLFCIYFYIIQMGLIRSSYANAVGIWWEYRRIETIEMICNLFLNFVLGWRFGMNGILLATIITVFFCSIIGLTYILLKQYFQRSIQTYIVDSIMYMIVTLIAIKASSFLVIKISIEGIGGLFIDLLISVFTTICLWTVFCGVVSDKRTYVISMIKAFLG